MNTKKFPTIKYLKWKYLLTRQIQKKGQITILNIISDSRTYWGYDEFKSHKISGKMFEMSIVKLGFFAIKILTIGLLTKQPSSIQVAHLIPCKCQ